MKSYHDAVTWGEMVLSSLWAEDGVFVGNIMALNATLSTALVHITHYSATVLLSLLTIWFSSARCKHGTIKDQVE